MSNDNTLFGNQLHIQDQKHVLAAFINRFTAENYPAWKNDSLNNSCPVQFSSDHDWLQHTEFFVKTDGRLDLRHKTCWSHPTWPENPELRKS